MAAKPAYFLKNGYPFPEHRRGYPDSDWAIVIVVYVIVIGHQGKTWEDGA